MATFDLRAYARRGAEARVAELNQELEGIYSAFPDLRTRQRGNGRVAAAGPAPVASKGTRRSRRRWKMSAAQKKAVSERMRKYWAKRRKTQQ